MLSRLRMLTAGESHGPKICGILDGLPAGIPLSIPAIDEELARRQKGYGAGGRMKIEHDRAKLVGGFLAGQTTGGPLAVEVSNIDFENWHERDIPPMTRPRPGHADLTGAIKYGYRDLRLSLERASARETVARVALGAVCKQVLLRFGIEIGGYVTQLGGVSAEVPWECSSDEYRKRFELARASDLCCPNQPSEHPMTETIKLCRRDKDTVGGQFQVVALGLPPGLGSYVQWDRRLDARLGMALLSIPAMKGVEIGPAFHNSTLRGSEVQDELFRDDAGVLFRQTNRAGGLEGGITTGEPLVLQVAMKPISTTLEPRQSVDLATGKPAGTRYERSDICALPRAVAVGEAMVSLVLCDALLEKLGGDSLDEMLPRFDALRKSRLLDLVMDNKPWRFGYE